MDAGNSSAQSVTLLREMLLPAGRRARASAVDRSRKPPVSAVRAGRGCRVGDCRGPIWVVPRESLCLSSQNRDERFSHMLATSRTR